MKNILFLTAIAIAATSTLRAGSPDPLKPALDKYLQIQTTLAGDSIKGVAAAAGEIAAIAKADAGAFPAQAAAQAGALAKAADIAAARDAFKPLSATMVAALSADKSLAGPYYEAYCPMAKASWIQASKKVANPYFGASMSGCGEIRKSFGSAPRADAGPAAAPSCSGS